MDGPSHIPHAALRSGPRGHGADRREGLRANVDADHRDLRTPVAQGQPHGQATRHGGDERHDRQHRLEDAREQARAGLKLNPGFTIARFLSATFSDRPAYLAGPRERGYRTFVGCATAASP